MKPAATLTDDQALKRLPFTAVPTPEPVPNTLGQPSNWGPFWRATRLNWSLAVVAAD